MKKYYLFLGTLMLTALLFKSVIAREKVLEKKVMITYTWSRIKSHGSNQLAVWIEDTKGKYICTLFATRFTASGGYAKRPVSLSEWTAKSDLKNAAKNEVDAITCATPESGKQMVVWNCMNKSGKVVPPGTYVVRMEANIHNSAKMFFRGEIKVGGSNQKTNGKITFSNPGLANGEVLFKDVLVEYK